MKEKEKEEEGKRSLRSNDHEHFMRGKRLHPMVKTSLKKHQGCDELEILT